ncbi:Yet1 protein [Hanseniaspora uvarum]|nr:Yet1 protein [Hanseniaspora uvarum]
MAVYLTILFGLLVLQLTSLLILSLPLPTLLRRALVKIYDQFLFKSSQVKTILIVVNILVVSLFVDSYKRASVPLPKTENGLMLQPEILATKAYHQRNVYISGFILYSMIVIPIMLGLITKVTKLSTEISTYKTKANDDKEEDEELKALKQKLNSKIKSFEVLEKQYANRKSFVDEHKLSVDKKDSLSKKAQ